ncbi:MAG TPA: NAD(P)H-quinone oxidoreductase, partial [Thermoanaerobaculia bacterium]|nr:NAD(P)H-quinone oxidoreductase [Thermoanaerobaculia bacterium]
MKALLPFATGSPGALRLGELPDPVAGPGEVLIRVCATALNRADLLQMRGRYPPSAGESSVPG